MTTLEIILIAIIWIAYGIYAAHNEYSNNYSDKVGTYVAYISLAPLIFICKCLYGAFKSYK